MTVLQLDACLRFPAFTIYRGLLGAVRLLHFLFFILFLTIQLSVRLGNSPVSVSVSVYYVLSAYVYCIYIYMYLHILCAYKHFIAAAAGVFWVRLFAL